MAKKFLNLSTVLKKMLFQKGMRPVDLARQLNMPQPTIHRIVEGKSTRPNKTSLEPIAKYFSLNIEQLLGEEPLPEEKETKNHNSISKIKYVPIIDWDAMFGDKKEDVKNKIPFFDHISDNGFATIMSDASMEPFIQRNSIIIFDPDLIPTDRSHVLVRLNDTNSYVVRQLLVDADHRYLKPLNPDLSAFKMRLLHKSDEIIACLVEIRFNLQNEHNSGMRKV